MSDMEMGYEKTWKGRGSGPRAGFWTRFAAAFIDGIVLVIVNVILREASKGAGEGISLLINIGYYTYLEGRPQGQTFGKSAMNIRVISLSDGQPIGYGRAFVRWVGRIVSAVVILLGYFWMLWDGERQCWHDKFAGAVVVPTNAYPVPNRY